MSTEVEVTEEAVALMAARAAVAIDALQVSVISAADRLQILESRPPRVISTAADLAGAHKTAIVTKLSEVRDAFHLEMSRLDNLLGALSEGAEPIGAVKELVERHTAELTERLTTQIEITGQVKESVSTQAADFDAFLSEIVNQVGEFQERVDESLNRMAEESKAFLDQYEADLSRELNAFAEEVESIIQAVVNEFREPIDNAVETFVTALETLQADTVLTFLTSLEDAGAAATSEISDTVQSILADFDSVVGDLCDQIAGREGSSQHQVQTMQEVTRLVHDAFEETIGRVKPVKKIAGIVGFSID